MAPELGGICGTLTEDLPLGHLQVGCQSRECFHTTRRATKGSSDHFRPKMGPRYRLAVKSVTLSVGNPLCPCGIAYCWAYGDLCAAGFLTKFGGQVPAPPDYSEVIDGDQAICLSLPTFAPLQGGCAAPSTRNPFVFSSAHKSHNSPEQFRQDKFASIRNEEK